MSMLQVVVHVGASVYGGGSVTSAPSEGATEAPERGVKVSSLG